MSVDQKINRKLFKVGKDTETKQLAVGIYAEVKKGNALEVTFVGSRAGFIATKAIAVAHDRLAEDGKELWASPSFEMTRDIEGSDSETVALTFKLKTTQADSHSLY